MQRRLSAGAALPRRLLIQRRALRYLALPHYAAPPCVFSPVLTPAAHFSTEAPPPPVFRRPGRAPDGSAAGQQLASRSGHDLPAGDAAATAPDAFSPEEVRALLFSVIPEVPVGFRNDGQTPLIPQCIGAAELQRQAPRKLREFMEKYELSAKRQRERLPCAVWRLAGNTLVDCRDDAVGKTLVAAGVRAYLIDHFPTEVVLFMPNARLARKRVEEGDTSVSPAGADHNVDAQGFSSTDGSPSPLFDRGSSSSSSGNRAPLHPVPHAGTLESASLLSNTNDPGSALPPPPQPQGPSRRYGSGTGSSFFGAAPLSTSGQAAGGGAVQAGDAAPEAPLRTPIQVMEVLVEYIPTFFVSTDVIEPTLPSNVQRLYSDTSFRFFVRRLKHYVDVRSSHNVTEVRLRSTFDHPKRGVADAQYRIYGGFVAEGVVDGNQLRRPPRNSEANLISSIVPRVPKTFTPLAEVLLEVAPLISRHPAFDARLGVMGLLGKYPEYFQIVEGKLRARPYREAPNSLDDRDRTTSPLPDIFAKVLAAVEAAAEGKDYHEPAERAAATVSTGRLYSLLTADEKATVKQKCRSFPTFLRMHGKELVVSVDKMRVYKFLPEYEACADTLLDDRLRMNSIDPNDPILKIPAEMAAESNAEWAIRELYDALPLMQCAELDELLSLVPPAVRDALPTEVAEVEKLLQQYSDYFTTWRYPDDETVVVVQRAKVEQPELDQAAIVRMVVPLIPQGGTTLASLRTRAPLQLQRYFHRHGTVATLGAMKGVFAIAGERIVRLV